MSKATQAAIDRTVKHSMQDQLIAHVEEMLSERRREKEHDQADIVTAFAADNSWSGQHERLANPKGLEPWSES